MPRDIPCEITESNLFSEVAALLDVEHLADVDESDAPWPLRGVLFGPCRRPMVCVPVQLEAGGPVKNVICVVDPNEPVTRLSRAALSRFLPGAPPAAARARLNGVACVPWRIEPGRPDVTVLGADFLAAARAILCLDYVTQTVTIEAVDR